MFFVLVIVVDFLLVFFYTDTKTPLYNPNTEPPLYNPNTEPPLYNPNTAPTLYNPNTQSYEVGPPGAFVPPTYIPIQV